MKIGIGITTYNRLKVLQQLLDDIKSFPPSVHKTDLFICDDGSSDGTVEYLNSTGIPFITSENQGNPWSKNSIIARFHDYDYIFVIEDDLVILKPYWADFFINAMEISGENHLCYVPEYLSRQFKEEKIIHDFGDFSIIENYAASGVFMVFTGYSIKRIGGYDTRIIGYGHAHTNMTDRMYRSGLNKFAWPHLKDSEKFLSLRETESSVDRKRANDLKELNQFVLFYWAYSLNAKVLSYYCSPWPRIVFHDKSLIEKTGIGIITEAGIPKERCLDTEKLKNITPEPHDIAIVKINPCHSFINHKETENGITIYNSDTLCGSTHKNILLAHFKNHKNIIILEQNIVPLKSGWLSKCLSLLNDKVLCYGFTETKENMPVVLNFEIKTKPFKYPVVPIIVFNHRALELLGGFDEKFIGSGMEIMEFFKRSFKIKIGEMHILSSYLQNKYFHCTQLPVIRGIFDIIPQKNVETEMLLEYMENSKFISHFRPIHDVN